MTSKLKEEREKAGYTVEQVAEKLKIRRQYIIDLEEENFESLPGKIYVKGYIKMYHEFLDLELPADQNISKCSNKVIHPVHRNKLKRNILALVTSVVLILTILFYSHITRPPIIDNHTTIEHQKEQNEHSD
ncbi:MAG: helix-turn-helix domain-containing protein [Rickettsiaceae bacterium]